MNYKLLLLSLTFATTAVASTPAIPGKEKTKEKSVSPYSGELVADEGAWCWFADPRAIEFRSKDGTMHRTIIGYIDNHGSIKATQVDHNSGTREEVLIRSWFQPDDHNNPAFLVLPDERIMVFYSRHTDEPCFYYRVSQRPGDITILGEEKVLKTANNTTYPNPFILSDDPTHIYMTWRGIGWHPTVARMTMPDKDDNIRFDWGPHQMVQSSGARPYAKYISNGKDKIYLAYTTGHPDNEYPNWLYCNAFDINTRQLSDMKGNVLSTVGTAQVRRTEEYLNAHPAAVVDHPADSRDWIWNMAFDAKGNPVIGMTHISKDKHSHTYYTAHWTGTEWQKTFIANGGTHFHQSPETENCYSGGMAVDRNNPAMVYCSVPVGDVYEIKRYTLSPDLSQVTDSALMTHNSLKNNARPFVVEDPVRAKNGTASNVLWMNGDYYFWIVNTRYPKGYPTSIMSNETLPSKSIVKKDKNTFVYEFDKAKVFPADKPMTLQSFAPGDAPKVPLFTWKGLEYGIDRDELTPYIKIGERVWRSQNKFATADSWATDDRATTDGKWYAPVMPDHCTITMILKGNVLTVLHNGIIDQRVEFGK